jgi:hypothetical protein
MQGIRLGEILISQGTLSAEQVAHILRVQRSVGRPFGDLAERLYGIHPRSIERAWAWQYARLAGEIDPAILTIDPRCVRLINRRQAWQFHCAPFARRDGELQLLTDQQHLPRALSFASATFREPVTFLLACTEALHEHLMQLYPVPEHLADYAARM